MRRFSFFPKPPIFAIHVSAQVGEGPGETHDLITKVKKSCEAQDRWPLGELERLEKVFQSCDVRVLLKELVPFC